MVNKRMGEGVMTLVFTFCLQQQQIEIIQIGNSSVHHQCVRFSIIISDITSNPFAERNGVCVILQCQQDHHSGAEMYKI